MQKAAASRIVLPIYTSIAICSLILLGAMLHSPSEPGNTVAFGLSLSLISITGLGHLFIDPGIHTRLMRNFAKWLYRISLRRTQVIFENPADRDIFIKNKFLKAGQTHLILGTCVDMEKFYTLKRDADGPVVLFASRFLTTKGLPEFVEAAQILKQKEVRGRFAIAGTTDPGNPASIPQAQIDSWKQSGLTEWWGRQFALENFSLNLAIQQTLSVYRQAFPTKQIAHDSQQG
jgi:hypothetical protein